MDIKKTKEPAIRFKGFTGNWEQRKVTEVGEIYIGLVTTMTKHYTDEGTLLIRNSDIKDGRFEFGDNPIFLEKPFAEENESRMHQLGDVITVHTGDVGTSAVITEKEEKSIGFATIVTRPDKEIIDSNYLCSFLNTDKHKKWAVGVSTGDGRTNYNLRDYYELVVPIPSIREQKMIAAFIQKANHLITLHQRELDLMKQQKRSLLSKMFPKNGAEFPELRFIGFANPWEQRKLGEIGSVSMCRRIFKEQTSESGDIPFYKIGTFGAKPDAYISKELFEEYKAKYPYPKQGDILISASGSIGRTVEFTGRNEYFQDSNIVWLNHDERLSNSFLKCFYSVVKWAGIEGSTIKRLYNDNILNTPISLPTIPEQKQIGAFFANFDHLITLHQRKLETLKSIKKSFLAKMLV
ncbi:type I restriction enzyme S subunit [Lachnospiraceae bacterium PM6-15]|uniref:restriction endonuclease subunit S n=1 Tax=Ohessyouella blattaphilus TaxID=2949333 RepID=UPI003E209B2D